MNGVLVVDKPAGPTSHDVVARVRRAIGVRRIGHTGTLDPLATGVLPLVVGRATRLAQFLTGADKEYVAGVRFGASTATYDAEDRVGGTVAPVASPSVARADVERALSEFRGTYLQSPPPFSAKKIAGIRAYKLARSQKTVEVAPVEVTVHELACLAFADGLAQLRIVCSSGFYVRSLAHDLGQRLGCGAYLESLRRTRAGVFDAAQAVPLERIEREGTDAISRTIPMNALLVEFPPVTLTETGVRRASHGQVVTPADVRGAPPAGDGDARFRLIDERGTLLGVAECRAGALHPVVVLV
jgi:tRNA pseudouridine55 synthase